MSYMTVAHIGDLAPGDIRPIAIAGVEMILYRVGDRYYAAQRYCIHQHADLATSTIADDGFVVCGLHGWRFHVDTGVHEMSPATCLRTYAVRVQDEHIQVDPTPQWRGHMPP